MKPLSSPLRTVLDGIWFRHGSGVPGKVELDSFKGLSPSDQEFARLFEQGLRLGKQSEWETNKGSISTRNLALPAIDALENLCQSIATLDVLISTLTVLSP